MTLHHAESWVVHNGQLYRRGRQPMRPDGEPGLRPIGPKYVRYEDLYVSGDTLQQVINRVTGGKVLTFPVGEFTFSGFGNGFYEGVRLGHPQWGPGCRGLAGSGRDTIFKMVPNSATTEQKAEGNKPGPAGNSNPLTLITVTPPETAPLAGVELRNFSIIGTPQGTYYNGLTVRFSPGALIDNLYLRGANPGFAGLPPGETFGVSVYKSANVTLSNSEFDGRDPSGTATVCASPFGWNSSNGGRVIKVNAHDSLWGMPTFWDSRDIYTEDLISHRHGSGPSRTNGNGINMENVGGIIRHIRPNIIANSGTGSPGMHISLANGNGDANDVVITDPIFDPGHRDGCFSIMIPDNYVDPQGRPESQVTMPTVTRFGVPLIAGDANAGIGNATPQTVWYRYH